MYCLYEIKVVYCLIAGDARNTHNVFSLFKVTISSANISKEFWNLQ